MAQKKLPPLVYIRESIESQIATSIQTLSLESAQRRFQNGELSQDCLVLFEGLRDWVPAHMISELWADKQSFEKEQNEQKSVTLTTAAVESRRHSVNKKRFGLRIMLSMAAVAIAFLGLGAVTIYFIYFRYVPVATQHLPQTCLVATRIDVEQWANFQPVKEHLFPVFNASSQHSKSINFHELRARLKSEVGLDLHRDIREVAMCLVQDTSPIQANAKPDAWRGFRWAVALGGTIKKGLILKLYETLRKEPWASTLRIEKSGSAMSIRMPWFHESLLTQAEDGTLLLSPNEKMLDEMRELDTRWVEPTQLFSFNQKDAFELKIGQTIFGVLGTPEIQQGKVNVQLHASLEVNSIFETKTETQAQLVEQTLHNIVKDIQKDFAKHHSKYVNEQTATALTTFHLARNRNQLEAQWQFRNEDIALQIQNHAHFLHDFFLNADAVQKIFSSFTTLSSAARKTSPSITQPD